MCFSTESLSTSSASAWRTAGSDKLGCLVLRLERSPSTSVHGSVLLSWMCSMPPPLEKITRPLPPFSRRCRISSSTCMFQPKSNSPVCSTARAADTASPPRSEEHTSELQSPCNLVCRLLLEKKKKNIFLLVFVKKKN